MCRCLVSAARIASIDGDDPTNAESAPAARLFSSGRVEVSVVGFSPRLFGVGCGRLRRLNDGCADSRIGDLSESSQETDTLLLGGEVVVVVEIIARGLLSELP